MGQLLHILRDDVARQRGERLAPAGLDQQGRRAVRGFGRRSDFEDTVATGPGSADALGDDQAERHSGWGMLSDSAAPDGGKHREPSKTARDDTPSAAWVVLIGVLCVAAVGACALIAQHLPRVPST